MNTTIDFLKSNRKWLVPNFVVWGDNGTFEADMIMTEFISGDERIVFNHEFTGETAQTVVYKDLVDHRGNQLPEKIVNPEVILIPKLHTRKRRGKIVSDIQRLATTVEFRG
jgi:hypothetical protein